MSSNNKWFIAAYLKLLFYNCWILIFFLFSKNVINLNSVGETVNLMAIDSQRMMDVTSSINTVYDGVD